MIRVTNLTDKYLNIAQNVTINPHSYLDIHMTVSPKLRQLLNMGVVNVQTINNINNDNNDVSAGFLRRQQMMDKIRKGDIKPGVSLYVSSLKDIKSNKTSKSNKINKTKKVKKCK